jgi:hypothetical protein
MAAVLEYSGPNRQSLLQMTGCRQWSSVYQIVAAVFIARVSPEMVSIFRNADDVATRLQTRDFRGSLQPFPVILPNTIFP